MTPSASSTSPTSTTTNKRKAECLLNIAAAASISTIDQATLRRAVDSGELPTVKYLRGIRGGSKMGTGNLITVGQLRQYRSALILKYRGFDADSRFGALRDRLLKNPF